jgi:hemerythrin HHE cation binding domain-containing protein
VKTADLDVIAVLRDQHRQIRRAFVRAARPGRGRSRAFYQLVQLLATHDAAEEAHIHPTARRAGRTAVAAARVGEEKQAKELLARLYRIGPHGDGYLRVLRSLRRAVLAHAAREEREEFPALARLGQARRRMLGLEVRLAKELAPTRPHPRVNGELANRLAMPVLGPADRCRDLIRRWRGGA